MSLKEEAGRIFHFINVPSDGVINVGYETSNHICFREDFLSDTVGARIEYLQNGKIVVRDTDSINGAYLNRKKMTESQADYGDELYLVGL